MSLNFQLRQKFLSSNLRQQYIISRSMRRYKRATHVTLVGRSLRHEAKVNIMANLYINRESAFEIQEQGKMKTVTVVEVCTNFPNNLATEGFYSYP